MTRRVRMLQTANGAPEPCTHTYEYTEGKVYDVDDDLGRVFVEFGHAECADDYEPAKGEELPTPEGQEVPETEEERRAREAAAEGALQPPPDLSILDEAHHPAHAAEIEQAKADAGESTQDAPALDVDVNDKKLSRAQLDEAAQAIGLATASLPNKDAVRAAIRDAQGGQ